MLGNIQMLVPSKMMPHACMYAPHVWSHQKKLNFKAVLKSIEAMETQLQRVQDHIERASNNQNNVPQAEKKK